MHYTVGEVAERVKTSAHTLRYYSKEGLLPFVDRDKNGVRRFKDADFEWLFLISCLKRTGMPIREIKRYIDWSMQGDATIAQRLDMIKGQQEKVERQIAELREAAEVLAYKRWRYEKASETGSMEDLKKLREQDMPQEVWQMKQKIENYHKEEVPQG